MKGSLAHRVASLALVALVAMMCVAPAWKAGPTFGVWRDAHRLYIVDFCAHLVFARGVWTGHASHAGASDAAAHASAYAPASHLAMSRAWAREPLSVALPFGYSPVMLYVLGPLTALPNHMAFAIWMALSLLAVYWLTHPSRTAFGAGLILFLTPLGLSCFRLGQTACVGAAALLFLAGTTLVPPDTTDTRRRFLGLDARGWGAAVVLAALAAKPPLALAAGAALLALGRVRVVACAVALAALCALIATPWLGTSWPRDYLELALHYDRVNADPAFAWSLAPARMSTLRALLALDFGVADDVASRASSLAWLASLVALVVVGRRTAHTETPRVWAVAILGYLALCPHVTATEVLLAIVPLVLCLVPDVAALQRPAHAALFLTLVALPTLSPSVGPLAGVRWPQFLLLVGLAVALRPRIARVPVATAS